VPFGFYPKPSFYDEKNIKELNKFFNTNKITFEVMNFMDILKFAKRNDFVYFDPPYDPITDTSSFTSYTKDGFSRENQTELSLLCEKLHKKGVKIMQSNNKTPFIEELYNKPFFYKTTIYSI